MLFPLLLAGLGAFFFWLGWRWLKQRRLILALPTSKCRSIAMGLVEVAGKVVPITTLTSPLSKAKCVYYQYLVEEHRQQGKQSRWVTIRRGSQGTLFYLQDETGSVLIDPTGAEIDIPKDFTCDSGFMKDPPASIMDFLKAEGLSHENFLGINKRMRYSESYLAPGDQAFILGNATNNPAVKTALKNVDNIVIGKGSVVFYIADKPEKEIIKKLYWKSLLGIWGGAILMVTSLLLLVLQWTA